ncbi:MAG: RNA methyltransferase [Paludibacteraceae bacterium]|nr:RNA methyltransferase [Paludibacteraceae bacterium]
MSRKLDTEEIIRISTDEFKQAKKIPLVIVLDNVRSMHNIGSVFRTSDAYVVEKVVLCGITAQPPHPDIHKSALGAEFSVDWEYYADTNEAVAKLKADGYEVWAIELAENSVMLQDFFSRPSAQPATRYAVVLGNEVKGVQQSVIDQCEGCIELPQFGTKHSLNVSVTAGIVIWEFFKHLK